MSLETYAYVLVEARRAFSAGDLVRAAKLYAVIALCPVRAEGGVQ